MLTVQNLCVEFGGIAALNNVSFEMQENQILGLIGPNGAGKTTLFNCLSRLYHPTSGDIRLLGKSILALPAHRICEVGVGRTFQNVALFGNMTVADNLRVGSHWRTKGNIFADGLGSRWNARREQGLDREIAETLDFLDLNGVAGWTVSELPFGTLKRVELARALMTSPKLLLLDEPAGGLNHEEVFELGDVIRRIRDERGVSILLVEHHMGLVMSAADFIVVLNFGEKLAEGTPSEVQTDSAVIKAYLGGEG